MTPPALLIAAALTAAAVLVSGCTPTAGGTEASSAAASRVPAGTLEPAAARARLAELRTAAAGSLAGYERDCGGRGRCVFGRPWADVDADGCDQRSQVLVRDLLQVQRRPGRCAPTAGVLADPYTGTTVALGEVEIDHVVPLAEMWRTGAATWPLQRRIQAANHLGNLLAVQGKANRAKGDRTPDQWLPPARAGHCAYARIYVTTKDRHQLSVTAPERTALQKALATCT